MNTSISNDKAVWVIDDDQSIRWVLERSLSNAGFNVKVFETGSTALAQFKRADIDSRPMIILTDFRMPGLNGFEFLKQIKHIDANLPVIIMTAYSDLDTTVQAYQEGAFEYLPKPFDIDEAIELVSKAYEKQIELLQAQSADNTAETEPPLNNQSPSTSSDWQTALQNWARQSLAAGDTDILSTAVAEFEKILIDTALEATNGRKQEAAKLLGWGRNTLTRKLKQLDR